jgi:hypothetical protein
MMVNTSLLFLDGVVEMLYTLDGQEKSVILSIGDIF